MIKSHMGSVTIEITETEKKNAGCNAQALTSFN